MRILSLVLSLALFPAFALAEPWGSDLNPDFSTLANAALEERETALQAYFEAMNQRRKAGEISYSDAARLNQYAARQLYPGDANLHELLAFDVMIGSKVDAKQITIEEHDYLRAQKIREFEERRSAAAQQQDAAAYAEYQQRLYEIDQRAQQQNAILQRTADQIRQRVGGQRRAFCSTVPDGLGGYRTMCQ